MKKIKCIIILLMLIGIICNLFLTSSANEIPSLGDGFEYPPYEDGGGEGNVPTGTRYWSGFPDNPIWNCDCYNVGNTCWCG